MAKARSRLNLEKLQSTTAKPLPQLKPTKKRSNQPITLGKRYFKHSPTLILSLPFFVILGAIVTNLRPSAIKNLILTNSYLVFLLPFFLGLFFLFSFLLLKTRRGLAVSLFLTGLVFLKLQQVVLSPIFLILLAASIFLPLLIIELVTRFIIRNR